MLHANKGQTMKNTLLDYVAALVIALLLLIGFLSWFDILVK